MTISPADVFFFAEIYKCAKKNDFGLPYILKPFGLACGQWIYQECYGQLFVAIGLIKKQGEWTLCDDFEKCRNDHGAQKRG